LTDLGRETAEERGSFLSCCLDDGFGFVIAAKIDFNLDLKFSQINFSLKTKKRK
jgi:hypothetical protein